MKSTSRRWEMLYLLFAFLLTRAHGQNTSCSFSEFSFETLNQRLKDMKDCLESVSDKWAAYQNANIYTQLHVLTDIIQEQLKKDLKKFLPKNCPDPVVPEDGGLLCVSVTNKTYCKPMCNAGYDFSFMRRSRLYEECSAATQHKWTTQFIGGNRLAICSKSHIAVAGAPSAYFPEVQDCHKIKSHEQQTENITKNFKSELATAGIRESFDSSRLFCGKKNIN